MIRDQIDNRLELVPMESLYQLPELLQTLGWLLRVIRTDIEVILDGVGTASEAL